MKTILDDYFSLADRVPFDEVAMTRLIDLFAEEAEVKPVGSDGVRGRAAILQLFQLFFQTYSSIQRVWKIQATEQGLEAVWAIAGKRRSGQVFAMHGRHIAKLDPEGKISHLQVELLAEPS